MPAKRFEHILHDLGMAGLEHPLFCHVQVQFYRDLSGIAFQPERLSREIILGDIGGWRGFVSSVYLTGPGPESLQRHPAGRLRPT